MLFAHAQEAAKNYSDEDLLRMAGVTITDLVLTLTELLRHTGVVGKFVEFCGPGIDELSVPDRATLANMCPEYGATVGYLTADASSIKLVKS